MALQVGLVLLIGFMILLVLGVPIAISLAIPSIAAMVITLYIVKNTFLYHTAVSVV